MFSVLLLTLLLGATDCVHFHELLYRILPEAIFLGPNKTETMFMIVLTPNIVLLIFLGLLEAILTSVCIVSGYFMFMYRFLSMR